MESKVIRPQAEAIQDRFFAALDILVESNKIKSLNAFCAEYGLHRPKYSNLRTRSKDKRRIGTGYKFIDIDSLCYLSRDFGISSEWLLIGRGGMFKTQKSEV